MLLRFFSLLRASAPYSGPSSIQADGSFNAQVKLQWNIITWRHLLTLTAHEVQPLSSPLREQRSREQTLCLIRAEVSTLAKCKKNLSTPFQHPHPKSVQSPANSFPIFPPPVSPRPPHLKNGVTFTALAEKCCQRLSQSAEKFQRVSRGNPTLVNSECYISDIAALGKSKNYLLMGFLWKAAVSSMPKKKSQSETLCNEAVSH